MVHGADGAPGGGGNGGPAGRRGLLRRVIAQPVTTVADALVPVVVDAVDLNEAVNRVDVNELVQRIDVDVLMSKVDIEGLVDRIDVGKVAERIDVNVLLAQLDVEELLDRVDPNRILDDIDVNALLARIDVDALIERVDIDALLGRVDVDKLMSRVDVNALAERVEIGTLVGRGTQGVLRSFIDLLRRQLVGLDVVVMRLIGHLKRRSTLRDGPARLVGTDAGPNDVSGRYAGPISRLVAFAIDVGVVFVSYTLAAAMLGYLTELIWNYHLNRAHSIGWAVALAVWAFLYLWGSLAVAGRTVGKALVGLRVVATDGSPVTQRSAFVRAAVYPLSLLLVSISLVILLIHPERRTLHDFASRTAVVYDWGDRPAEMPAPLTSWLARRGALRPVATDRSTHRTSPS